MADTIARSLVHLVHSLATLVLIATGFVIEFPELRASLVGGYGPQIAWTHDWVGVLFLAAPLLALGVRGRALLVPVEKARPAILQLWRRLHMLLAVGGGAVLGVTGFVLWVADIFPAGLADSATFVHVVIAWAFVAAFPLHLVGVAVARAVDAASARAAR